MKKLIQGIVDFHGKVQPGYRETFAKLALGQKPDALFVTCSDSRVAVNVFASTDPGDLFVIRNVGNLIPAYDESIQADEDGSGSEAAGVEFALSRLNVSHIVVCGHAECGAIQGIMRGRETISGPYLRSWLRHGEEVLLGGSRTDANDLSKRNVLLQIQHLKTYPEVKKRFDEGRLQLHGLWFDLPHADVYYYDPQLKEFVILDETVSQRIRL